MLDCGALLRRTVPVQCTSTVLVGLLVVLSFRIQEGRGRLGPRPQHPVSERGTLCCSFGPSKRIGGPGFDFNAPEGDTTLTEYHLEGKLAVVLQPPDMLSRVRYAVDRFQFLDRAKLKRVRHRDIP